MVVRMLLVLALSVQVSSLNAARSSHALQKVSTGVGKSLRALAFGVAMLSAPLAAEARRADAVLQPEAVAAAPQIAPQFEGWMAVDENSPPYLRSFFYFLTDPEEYDGDLLLHNFYIGQSEEGEALLAGVWFELLDHNSIDLYGWRGLVQRNIAIKRVAHFPNPFGFDAGGNYTVVAVEGLDLSQDYQPIRADLWPFDAVGLPVQMVSFGLSHEERIQNYVNLPARWRQCSTAGRGGALGVGQHTCHGVGELLDSAIFAADRGLLIGLSAGHEGEAMIPIAQSVFAQLVRLMHDLDAGETALAADPQNKLVTTWADLKRAYE